ncbi:hypothetical protein VKT23_016801 [Stygiomarasmius scandens]|uniref:Uncharacterized protein n=1 Tax=Marasmiellus scandens TaxID=2682957 RepID=A0ABR1IWX3_9AGAR
MLELRNLQLSDNNDDDGRHFTHGHPEYTREPAPRPTSRHLSRPASRASQTSSTSSTGVPLEIAVRVINAKSTLSKATLAFNKASLDPETWKEILNQLKIEVLTAQDELEQARCARDRAKLGITSDPENMDRRQCQSMPGEYAPDETRISNQPRLQARETTFSSGGNCTPSVVGVEELRGQEDVANVATDHVQWDHPEEKATSAQLITKMELTGSLNWADEVEQNEETRELGNTQLSSLQQREGEMLLQFQRRRNALARRVSASLTHDTDVSQIMIRRSALFHKGIIEVLRMVDLRDLGQSVILAQNVEVSTVDGSDQILVKEAEGPEEARMEILLPEINNPEYDNVQCQIYGNSALRQSTGVYQHPNATSRQHHSSEDTEADDEKGELDQLVPPTVTVRQHSPRTTDKAKRPESSQTKDQQQPLEWRLQSHNCSHQTGSSTRNPVVEPEYQFGNTSRKAQERAVPEPVTVQMTQLPFVPASIFLKQGPRTENMTQMPAPPINMATKPQPAISRNTNRYEATPMNQLQPVNTGNGAPNPPQYDIPPHMNSQHLHDVHPTFAQMGNHIPKPILPVPQQYMARQQPVNVNWFQPIHQASPPLEFTWTVAGGGSGGSGGGSDDGSSRSGSDRRRNDERNGRGVGRGGKGGQGDDPPKGGRKGGGGPPDDGPPGGGPGTEEEGSERSQTPKNTSGKC